MYNTNAISGSPSSTQFNIQFSVSSNTTAGEGLTSIRLFANSTVTDTGVTWNLTDGGSVNINQAAQDVTGVDIGGGLYAYDFSLSSFSGQALSTGQTYTLQTTGGTLASVYGLTTSSTITNISPYQGSAYVNQNFRFELSSVPEPGTLLLGGIAAVGGGGGVWWKRRRKSAGSSTVTESAIN